MTILAADKKTQECISAIKAAMELIGKKGETGIPMAMEMIGDKCEIGVPETKSFEMYGATVTVPVEVSEIAEKSMGQAEKVKVIAESIWAKNWASGMVNMVNPNLAGKEREEAVKRLSERLAENVV